MKKNIAIAYVFILIVIAAILTIMGCSVPRLSAPSYDDLAGSPMVMYPIEYIDEPTECEHFWVNQAIPQKDSTFAFVTDLSFSNKVIADKICICIHCHEINICF